jgi:hypothetical protein
MMGAHELELGAVLGLIISSESKRFDRPLAAVADDAPMMAEFGRRGMTAVTGARAFLFGTINCSVGFCVAAGWECAHPMASLHPFCSPENGSLFLAMDRVGR